ncbi:MAG: PQQ-binding-like beta-propeller repeat protein [Verrucomicrobiae bacterium]|nr:PQQ-binding-like beta-propeller repeat protein [Verrucomicrobiae bacterium]
MRLPAVFLLGHAVLTLHAGDWPAFLGPYGDATSSETGLIDRFPPEGPPVVWSRPVGTGYSAPSLLDGQLVLHHRIGDEERIEAFDAHTGQPRWHHASPTSFQDPFGYNNGPRASPLLTSNRVYTFGAEGRLLALDRATGTPVWERDTASDFTVPEAFFGVGSSPVLDTGHLIVIVGGQPDSGVVAFDPDTGATRWESVGEASWSGLPMIGWPGTPPVVWRRWDKQASYASPVPATFHGQRHTLCLTRQGLVSLNPTNGAVRFSFWFRARVNESVNAANPVVHDDLILLSAAYYRVGSVLLRVRPDGQGVDEVWRNTSLEMHWATPLLVGDHLYGFSGRNEPDAAFRSVGFHTGSLAWQRDDRWPPRSSRQPPVFGRGSLIHADGKLIALGEGGLLGLFQPDPNRCIELGRWQVPDLAYPCWAGPVLANGRLYLRSEDRLVCLDLRTQPTSPGSPGAAIDSAPR